MQEFPTIEDICGFGMSADGFRKIRRKWLREGIKTAKSMINYEKCQPTVNKKNIEYYRAFIKASQEELERLQ